MNRLQNYLCILLLIGFAFALPSNAQVTMGSEQAPDQGTILQMKQWTPSNPLTDNSNADKGFGLPRVKLEELTSLKPFIDPTSSSYVQQALLHQGMMVYNMTDDVAKGLKPGVYIWDGSSFWAKQDSEAQDFFLSFELEGAEFLDDEIVFSSGLSSIPFSSKELKIKWGPGQEVCELLWVSDTETAISWQSPAPLPGVTNTGGSHTLILEPKKFTEAQLKEEPFLKKTTTLIVKIQNTDGNVLTKNIKIRQEHDAFYIKGIKDGMYMQMGRSYKVNIATNFDWTMTMTGTTSIIKATDIPASGFTNEGGTDYMMELHDIDGNEGQSVTLTFKGPNGVVLDYPIQIKATKEYANAYMTPPTIPILIPIKQAYIAWKNELDVDLTLENTKMTTELVWQDEQDLIGTVSFLNDGKKGLERTIVVSPKADLSRIGSALIALKIDGEIAWSWHVWVTDYVPNNMPTVQGNVVVPGGKVYRREALLNPSPANTEALRLRNYTIMDRDLGAKIAIPNAEYKDNGGLVGFLYQWGRKDPFPPIGVIPPLVGGLPTGDALIARPLYDIANSHLNPATSDEGITVADVPTNIDLNVINAIKQPMTFYKGSPTNDLDWYSATTDVVNSEAWMADKKYKGIYDPCPQGWRVPVDSYAPHGIFNGEQSGNGTLSIASMSLNLTADKHSFGYIGATASLEHTGKYLLFVGPTVIRPWLWAADLANDAYSNTIWINFGLLPPQSNAPLIGWGLNSRAKGLNVRCVADDADQLVEIGK